MTGTNIPSPSFGPNGFVAPAGSSVLAGAQADVDSAMGGGLNPDLTTPQGQLASSIAAIVEDKNGQFTALANGVDPAYAWGRMQDAIGRIYFLTRNAGTATVLSVNCLGAAGTRIPLGAAVIDDDQNEYQCTATVTIPLAGNVIASFACTENGPIAVPASLRILQAVPGWESVDNPPSGVVGTNTENRAQFEARRQASVAVNATGILGAVKGAVLEQNGVIDAYVTENDTTSTVTTGGVALLANSLYVCAAGGQLGDIANAIYRKKPPGCATTGWLWVLISDGSPGYTPPFPQYLIAYQPAVTTRIVFQVTLKNSAQVPSNAEDLVVGALFAAVAGADATFVGSISGTTLTVTSISGGEIKVGQLLFGAGVLPNTAISALGTGTGGTGTYTVSVSQTISPAEPLNTGPVNPLQVDTRLGIGATAYASNYYACIAALGPWVQIISIKIGIDVGFQTPLNFTASATGTTLTVTAITNGAIAVGQVLWYLPGIPYGTTITAYGSGTGGTGTYTISNSVSATGSVSMLTTSRLPAASYTGAIASSVLTVSVLNGGTLAVGQFVLSPNVPPGTTITSQLSGTPGGLGTYAITTDPSFTLSAQSMESCAPDQDVVTFLIDEIPVLLDGDVSLVLQ